MTFSRLILAMCGCVGWNKCTPPSEKDESMDVENIKNEYKKLLNPVLNSKVFPNKLLELLNIHMISPRSSFSYDSPLVKELNKYDSGNKDFIYLDKIEDGTKFKYDNEKVYKKIKKRRKRYLCIETMSKRNYLFLPHAKVELL